MENIIPDKEIHCDIAYDKKKQRYVAYNTENGVVAVGVCVTSAIEAYEEESLAKGFVEPMNDYMDYVEAMNDHYIPERH